MRKLTSTCFIAFLLLIGAVSFTAIDCHAQVTCAKNRGIRDYNCDGSAKIFFLGDSLVSGVGDSANNNRGGYVLRVKKALPKANVDSYGVAGLTTSQLISILKKTFSKKNSFPTLRAKLNSADVIVLDLGRNDRWFRENPVVAYQRLVRIRNILSINIKKESKLRPMIVQSVLMLPNRGDQGPWVKSLNQIIFKRATSVFPGDLRFDTVSKRLLNKDQLHPTPQGYASLANVFINYAKKRLPVHFENNRPDKDKNGIPDIFE